MLTSFDRRAAAVLVPVALAVRVAVAWAPIEWLLRRVLGDDPFYYFTIARHLAAGHGFTFDGVEPTNGFHPLWLLIITPVLGVVRDPTLAVHVVLTIAACIDVAALFLLHRLLRESGVRSAIAAAAAALYALSPLVLSNAGPINGLETALNLALTVAFLTEYRRSLTATAAPGAAAGVRLGVWSGLLFLTRTDNVILLLCCHVWLLWRALRRGGGRRAHPAASIATAAIIAAPWLAWSWARFGSPVQVSGLAVAHVTRELAASATWLSVATKLLHNLATLASYVPIYRVNERSFVAAAAGNAIIVAALAAGTVLCYRGDAAEGRRAFVGRLAPWAAPVVASGLFIATHTLRAVELRGWYYSASVPVAALVLALAADYVAGCIATAPAATRRLLSGAAAIVVAVVLASSLRVGAGRRCGEVDGYAMIARINQTPHVYARLASWNAGLFGYFYERGEVVNLDGLVNNAAYAAILTRSVGAYAARRDVDYLLDAAGAIELAKPYWDGGRPVTLPPPAMDNAAGRECRSLVLVPLH